MLPIKYNKTILTLCFCISLGLLAPAVSHADEVNSWGGTSGPIDAGKAAEQRAAVARREAKKQKRAEEKKAAETQNKKSSVTPDSHNSEALTGSGE
jgi:hypothetical protein